MVVEQLLQHTLAPQIAAIPLADILPKAAITDGNIPLPAIGGIVLLSIVTLLIILVREK